ncbi:MULTISPECIES: helix-turn-helix domain-containing protein [unclassified Leptolyngbya]|uniref:helix-turn-helix domain-containing protein n=1 Tax=unclassified Leptolyngbya TaxID=2650499 RepID=UPI001681F106|nr:MULTISPECIES: helix-turn-helix domain-containing protein [unclassified Leptolyngbya]MBD1909153.1 helix-turn-helix domain-containing protein [Leptolyngbya sp. FACHB-8]MBD2157013.1 helix-turn-helix domain-containing protein [Leptolyngbya sp. FACHB-16]
MSSLKTLPISDVIHQLRQHFNLSQEKFAAKLGVSFKTVNRWENGRSVPSPMAMKLIEELLESTEGSKKSWLTQDSLEGERDV